MLLPQDIMMKVSQHYSEHIDAVQEAAELMFNEDGVEALMQRHNAFKANVKSLLDVEMLFCANTAEIKPPATNLFSVTVTCAGEPIFPDFIGKHTKLLVARWDDTYTGLYSLDSWEEDHDPLS